MLTFGEKAKLTHCEDVQKIIRQYGINTTLEVISKEEKYLYLTASTDVLLRMADEAELTKKTITGSMQKFNYDSISDFLLPGMTEDDIVRFCEAPVLIKDIVKPQLLHYINNGIIEELFPLHDIVSNSQFQTTVQK